MDLTPAGPLRRALYLTAIAATLPYLTLKLLWLCGSQVGVTDPELADSTTLWLLNLLTFGMDAAAVALASAFVRPWGRRIPAPVLAFPMWVATGLLGTLVTALALVLGSNLLLGAQPQPTGSGWLSPWVYQLVYGGFALQAVALTGGFLLYARERWAGLLHDRIGDLPRTATLPLQRVLAAAAAAIALPVAGVQLYWACGGSTGLTLAQAAEGGRPQHVLQGLLALAGAGGAAAVLRVALRTAPHRRLLPSLLVGWAAGGSVFGWGCWTLLASNVGPALPDPEDVVPGLTHLVQAGQLTVGLLVLVVGALTLVERASGVTAATVDGADVESVR